MPATVIVNMRTVVHANSSGIATSVPDVCKTPAPPGPPVPIPYPNIAKSSDTSDGSKKVKCDGNPIMLKDSAFSMSTGDEAGSLNGIVSNKIKGNAKFALYSFDVKVEGKDVPRLGDMMITNGNTGNTTNPSLVQPSTVIVGTETAESEEKCPKCGRKKHDKKYRRSTSERKKALIRDAQDPNSELDDDARKFILASGGDNVPPGFEVSHEEPLYTKPPSDRCELDTADNMKTEAKPKHRARHKNSGQQFHEFPPSKFKF